MLSLFDSTMAVIVNCLTGNHENVAYKVQVLLDNHLPIWNNFRLGLVSSVLNKIYDFMSEEDCPLDLQKEIIPLLKFCIKTSKVFCGERYYDADILSSDYCAVTMSKIINELDEEINEAIKDVDEYSAKENNAEKMNYLIDVDPNFNEETERRIDETLNESEKRKLFDDDEV